MAKRGNSDAEVRSFNKEYNNRKRQAPRHEARAQEACIDASTQSKQGNQTAACGGLKDAINIFKVGQIKRGRSGKINE